MGIGMKIVEFFIYMYLMEFDCDLKFDFYLL